MQKLFTTILIFLWVSGAASATIYVSNAASNGYGLGNDSTGTGTKAAPYLTIVKGLSVASSSQIVVVNPSGTTYVESGGSGYCSVNYGLEGDPAYLPSVPTIQTSSSSYAVVDNSTSLNVTIANLIIDCQSGSSKNAITTFANSATISNVTFYNVAYEEGGVKLSTSSSGTQSVSLDKCNMTSANGNNAVAYMVYYGGSGTSSNASITVTGSYCYGVGCFVEGTTGTPAPSLHALTFGTSTDGTRNTVSNCAYGVRFGTTGATISTFTCAGTDFINITNNTISAYATDYTTTVTTLSIQNCSFSSGGTTQYDIYLNHSMGTGNVSYNKFTGNHYNLYGYNVNSCSNMTVTHNYFNTQSMSGATNLALAPCGPNLVVANNTFISDGAHCIEIGADTPPASSASNTAASTGTFNLGDTASDNYLDNPFVWGNSNDGGQLTCGWVSFPLSKVGSPTGTLQAYLYSNNAGVPGTLLATSVNSYPASVIGSNSLSQPTTIRFRFENQPQMSYTGTFHVVLTYTGTNDGSNYVTIGTNTPASTSNGASVGTLNTSSNGTSWTAQTGKAIQYTLTVLNLECVKPQVYGNIIQGTGGSVGTHMIIVGSTDGASVYDNYLYGADICLIFKYGDGSVYPLLAYDNICWTYGGTVSYGGFGLYDKGSLDANYLHNTVVCNGQYSYGIYLINDYATTAGNYNGTPSRNAVVENNVVYVYSGNVYGIGGEPSSGAGGYDYQIVNPTINNNDVYLVSGYWGRYNLGQSETNTSLSSFASVQGLGYETTGLNVDPLLTAETSPVNVASFIPLGGSPILGEGLNLTATVATDYLGRTQLAAYPTIGALCPNTRTIAPRTGTSARVLVK